MKLAAFSFAAYACLIALAIVAIALYNPSSGDVLFLVEVAIVFGGLMLWAGSAAYALRKGKGLIRSFSFVGFLTMIVLIGLAQYGTLQIEEEIHPVLNVLRTVSGLSLLWLWVVLFRAVSVRRVGQTEI